MTYNFFRFQNLGFNECMSIAELGQYFCAITNSKKFRRFNRRRGVTKFPNRPLGRLKVQICLFNSDTTTTISSVNTVQLVLNYFDSHSYDTVVTVYFSIVKIRYYSGKFNIVYWFPRLYGLYTGASIWNRMSCFLALKCDIW